MEIFNWAKAEKTHEYGDGEFKGLVETLAWHPAGDWLVAGGGANDGWLMFFDLADEKKSLKDEKAPMHVHELALSEDGTKIWAVGHSKLVKWELGGEREPVRTPGGARHVYVATCFSARRRSHQCFSRKTCERGEVSG